MAIELHYVAGSPPCLIVLLVAAALDIKLNLKPLNLKTDRHLTPDFLKLYQHTVPTIVDNGFALWGPRAIPRYLASKYGGDSGLYPQDLQTRARIDQLLDFDLGSLYQSFATYYYPQIFSGAEPDQELLKKLKDKLSLLNTFLEDQTYAVGTQLTLADLSLVATVSTIDSTGISLAPYPNVGRWFELVKTTAPGYQEAIQKGFDQSKESIEILQYLCC